MDPPEDFVSLTGRPPHHPTSSIDMEFGEAQPSSSLVFSPPLPIRTRSSDVTLVGSGRYWRRHLLLFIAICLSIILWIATQSAEKEIEAALEEGVVEEAMHDDEILEGWDRDDETHNDAGDEKASTIEKNDRVSATESSVGGTGNSRGNRKLLAGFHTPTHYSFVTSAIYTKPKGVGYPLRPTGGVHPLYLADMEDIPDGASAYGDGGASFVGGDYAVSSPYADSRLRLTPEEREKEQSAYLDKLEAIRKEWGSWNFVDSKYPNGGRPSVDWSKMEMSKLMSGEIEKDEFEKGVWQGDDDYIKSFLSEARSLITRVRESIYAEYGLATSALTPEQIQTRNVQMGIHIIKPDDAYAKAIDAAQGVAWMHEPSYHALVKKLLNAMMTNDHFFVTLGGHSAAAGHGNNFHQSYMMQFQSVMEPVFDRLGMVLVSANRAQGGMGTAQAALAGGGVYGEKDVMLWDSSMTEKGSGMQDLFMRQMLLTGHRVPVLLDIGGGKGIMDAIHKESGAHAGGITGGTPSLMALTTSAEQAETLPFALRHLFCDKGSSTCGEGQYKYNAHCWTERVDVEPETKQNEGYGSQVSWHPGNRSHQWVARKLSLLFLQALEEAMNAWENAASADGNPIPGKYWHLTEEENAIREKLRNVDANETECGKTLTTFPRLCKTPMRGATEWAPRANPEHSSIRSLIKPAPNGYVPELIDLQPQLYVGRDPQQPIQRVPEGEVDVEAIARSIPPPSGNGRYLFTMPHQQHTNEIASQGVHERYLLRNESSTLSLRQLKSDELIPGEGWTVVGHPAGFCDGTLNQVCHREVSSECQMSGHADSRGSLIGDGLSGWVTFQLKGVRHGIFAGRIETWIAHNSNKRTEGWEAVNNGREDRRRELKAPPPPLPEDMKVEVAVNGEVQVSLTGDELIERCPHIAYNVPFCVLIDDEEMAKKNEVKDIDVSIRIIGGGRESILAITHVYFA